MKTLASANVLTDEEKALLRQCRHVVQSVDPDAEVVLFTGRSASRHSAVRAFLHQEHIRPGSLPREFGQLFDRLFDNRQEADCADLVEFDPDEVTPWFEETKRFVSAVSALAEKQMQE